MALVDKLSREAASLFQIPPETAAAYRKKSQQMLSEVNECFNSTKGINEMVGPSKHYIIYDFHYRHIQGMAEALSTNTLGLLIRSIPRVYQFYRRRGIEYIFFIWDWGEWERAILNHMAIENSSQILDFYEWLKLKQLSFIKIAEQNQGFPNGLSRMAVKEVQWRG